MYEAINVANNVIDAVDKVKDPSFTDDEKHNVSGQAYFTGSGIFQYGLHLSEVPLVLTSIREYDSSSVMAKSTAQEVYAQILKDLNEAESGLPEILNRYIATKKAAQALKARFYLYSKDWTNVELYADKLIGDPSEYSLVDLFDQLITVMSSNESILNSISRLLMAISGQVSSYSVMSSSAVLFFIYLR